MFSTRRGGTPGLRAVSVQLMRTGADLAARPSVGTPAASARPTDPVAPSASGAPTPRAIAVSIVLRVVITRVLLVIGAG